jgi:hypothetical protein
MEIRDTTTPRLHTPRNKKQKTMTCMYITHEVNAIHSLSYSLFHFFRAL